LSEEGSAPRKLIGEWLIEVTENAELMDRLRKEPDKTLDESGLSEDQKLIVKSGDPKKIRDAVREEYQRTEIMLFPMMFFWAAGGPEDDGSEGSGGYGSGGSKEAK
jgi:hypothetical protein